MNTEGSLQMLACPPCRVAKKYNPAVSKAVSSSAICAPNVPDPRDKSRGIRGGLHPLRKVPDSNFDL